MKSGRPGPAERNMNPDLASAKNGDRAALERIITSTSERLTALIEARLGPGLRARVRTSDVLQSSYLQILRDVRSFDGEDEDSFVRWAGSIVENNIRMKARYFAAAKRGNEREASDPNAAALAPSGASPSVAATHIEALMLVGRALERLPDEYQQVILLRTVEGLEHTEIAERMNRTPGAVRMLLSRARAALCLAADRLQRDGRVDAAAP